MKNPLMKRLPKEIKSEAGKYIVLFLFLVSAIGFVSGFLVADSSMKTAYDKSFEKYNIEDGHFSLLTKADDNLIEKLEKLDIDVEPIIYKDKNIEKNHTIRLFKKRNDINKVCVMNGKMPVKDDEIVLDRLYAQNNTIKIGDKIEIEDKTFKVKGFVALSDYSALFKSNTDMMFDANKFTVAIITDEAFDQLKNVGINYCYAWRYKSDLTEREKKDKSDEIKKVLVKNAVITDLVNQQDNQAIKFTGEDMGSDKSMITWMLYIIMVVLAFVFAVTARSTIEQEASVIGTLRALGYTKWEMLCHYMAIPVLVTLFAALIGNMLGYSVMKGIVVNMYYHSYSLPTYVTLWNGEAFILTTVIPCVIVFVVDLFMIMKLLSLKPLQFLRHELKKNKKKKVIKLPDFKFLTRFRLRIIMQNAHAYVIMSIGVILASLMLMFGMVMEPLLNNFKDEVINSKISNYQYILKTMVETKNSDAEKYCVKSLTNDKEDITVYGIGKKSQYLKKVATNLKDNEVILSKGYMEKYKINEGDTITLKDKYDDKKYNFKVKSEYDYAASLAVFLNRDSFNEIFDKEDNYFSGYFSQKKLNDIDKDYVASVITQNDLTVLADQLEDSMGMMLPLFCGFGMFMYSLIVYLLSKMILDRNASAISMVKILGYTDNEASKLYNFATTAVVVVSFIISLPICYFVMKIILFYVMSEMNGWITLYIAPWVYFAMVAMGIVCYGIVYFLQMKKIRKIPMAYALKNME